MSCFPTPHPLHFLDSPKATALFVFASREQVLGEIRPDSWSQTCRPEENRLSLLSSGASKKLDRMTWQLCCVGDVTSHSLIRLRYDQWKSMCVLDSTTHVCTLQILM